MNPAQFILVLLVRLYQLVLSPLRMVLFGPLGQCRFNPSCSQYMIEAIRIHGAIRGVGLGIWRICRCHPWGACGEDPVPPARISKTAHECGHSECQPLTAVSEARH